MSLVLCAALILVLGGGDLSSISEDDYDYSMPFEYRLSVRNLGDIPVGPLEYLGQNFYVEQRLVFASNLYCGDVSVTTEFEAGGIIDGDLTPEAVNHSRIARNHKYGWAVDRIFTREIYLKYSHRNFRIAAGQKLSQWGTGMIINNGESRSLIGDNYQGDTSAGLFLSFMPLGSFTRPDISDRIELNIGAGLIIRDNFMDIRYGDNGYHLTASLVYDSESGMDLKDGFKVGFLYSGRFIESLFGENTILNIYDVFIKKEHYLYNDITSPNIFFYFESAVISGLREKRFRGLLSEYDIFSYGLLIRTGITDRDYRLYLDIGFASGDDNPFDNKEKAFRFNTEFKEGMILFPELYGFSSAASSLRSMNLLFYDEPEYISDPETNGSISNTIFASLNLEYQFAGLFKFISSVLLAGTSEDMIDPYYSYMSDNKKNFFNSFSTSNLLGLELDFGVEREWFRNRYFRLKSLIAYGHLFAGGAFANDYTDFSGTDLLIFKFSIDNL